MASIVKDFIIEKSNTISDVVVFKPTVNNDKRGTLYTTFYADVFNTYIPEELTFKHDKFSKSYKNVLRGIHGDSKSWKLVTAVYGDIFQVVVDYRKNSETYLKWEAFNINQTNQVSILLPPGIGNAFLVLSDVAVYHYKLAYTGEYLDAEEQFSIKWNNENIGIKWPITNPVLSDRDK